MRNLQIWRSLCEIWGKTSDAKEVEAKDFEAPQPEVIKAQNPLRRNRKRSSHSKELILADKFESVRTRSSFKPFEETLMSLVSLIEPTSTDEALLDTK